VFVLITAAPVWLLRLNQLKPMSDAFDFQIEVHVVLRVRFFNGNDAWSNGAGV
jgi:hypothetical protein